MTAMPQMVALFNGVGGAAGALVALLELAETSGRGDWDQLAVAAFTVLIGSVTFSGSVLTFAKLQELITGRPLIFRGMRWVAAVAVAAVLATGILIPFETPLFVAVILAIVSLGLGLLLVFPVGGADVPIVISLLNAFSGITVAARRLRARQYPAHRGRHPGGRLRNPAH